jgi:mono/diheme cytochrome c family protein
MYKLKLISTLAIFVAFAFLNACKHDSPEPVGPTVSFKEHVLPIMIGNCSAPGCHDANSGEFPLLSYSDVIKHGEIEEGKGIDVKLIEVLKDKNENERMPPAPSKALTSNQIQIIELWISQGAKNN